MSVSGSGSVFNEKFVQGLRETDCLKGCNVGRLNGKDVYEVLLSEATHFREFFCWLST